MPNIKAAVKWARQTEKRALRNRDVKTRLKTVFKKARTAADPLAAPAVESQFDKAAQKGIIHPNKAARKKSRFARALQASIAAAAAPQASAARPAARKKSGAKAK